MRNTLKSIVKTIFTERFIKHYLRPLTVTCKKLPYDAKSCYELWHRTVMEKEGKFEDRMTISHKISPLVARFHYNSLENSIVKYFVKRKFPETPRVLDVGTGAGHWVDFYHEIFGASEIFGIEISRPCVGWLFQKYDGRSHIKILEADVSSENFNLNRKFDIISAIDVLGIVVEDVRWKQTIKNLAAHLSEQGVLIISGHFGFITQNISFVYEKNSTIPHPKIAYISKRVRSLGYWKKCVKQNELRIDCLKRTRQPRGITTPPVDLLFLKHNSFR